MLPPKNLLRAALPLALAIAWPLAFAQSTLDRVVVSASRAQQRVQDALPATTLITRDDIERAQTPDLPTLLREVAGVDIAQAGGPGTVSSTFLRGAESRHTLVLVDGVPITNLNFGTPALEHLPLADIERIEIVRGNVSSLYGSAALGGVIQIFTRPPSNTPQAAISAQAGSRGLVDVSATASLRTATGTGLRATVGGLRDRGFNATNQDELPGTNPDRDGYRRHSGDVAVTQELAGGNSIGLRLRDASGTTEYDSQFGPANQADVSQFAERGAVVHGHFRLAPALRLDAAMSRSEDRLDASVSAFPFFVNSRSDGAQLGLEWDVAQGQRVTAGVEHTRQHIESDTVYAHGTRTQDSARLGYTARLARHDVQLNVRRDRFSDFGTADTWLAGFGYHLTDAWRVSAMASTGFTAPTFNDLYYPFGGNPALRPERVHSAELGMQYAAHGQDLRATLFDNRYTDLIGNDAMFNRINIGRARTRGLELAYAGRIGATGLRAGATWQDPVDLDADARLQRRARTLANVGLTRDVGAWQFGGDAHATGRRPDAGRLLGGATVVDLTASYRVSPQLKVFGRIENLFDRRYETIYGYRQAARGAFVGLTWQPKA
jgi:vitamin B12 transporter